MNIYLGKDKNRKHIGKRWANGYWCYDCKVRALRDVMGCFWYCPKCGARASDETLFNPAMRELGFDKNKSRKRTGVDGSSGFIWCIDNEYGVGKNKEEIMQRLTKTLRKIYTEYGDIWSFKDFKNMFLDIIEEEESDGEFT